MEALRVPPAPCCVPAELGLAVPTHPPPGVAEQFAITEATLSAWSSLDDEELHPENSPQDIVQLQGTAWVGAGAGWVERSRWGVPATGCTVTSDKPPPPRPSALVSASVGWARGALPCPLPTGRRRHDNRRSGTKCSPCYVFYTCRFTSSSPHL